MRLWRRQFKVKGGVGARASFVHKCNTTMRPPLAAAIALAVLLAIGGAVAMCVLCTNVEEPRLMGKAAVLARLPPAHRLPAALATRAVDVGAALAQMTHAAPDQPLVVKPNAFTSCGAGVKLCASAAAARAHAHALLARGLPVLFQAYYAPAGGIEARLYGVRRLGQGQGQGLGQGQWQWQWDDVVWAPAPSRRVHAARAPMTPALAVAAAAVIAAMLPSAAALALDVRAPSLHALLADGAFCVLEVNGAFGLAQTWLATRGPLRAAAALVWDVARWLPPRVAHGARNLVRGAVAPWRRLAEERAWARGARAAAALRSGDKETDNDLI